MKRNDISVFIRNTEVRDFSEIELLLNQGGLGGAWFTRGLLRRLIRRNRAFNWVAMNLRDEIVGTVFGSHDGGYHGYICKLAVDKHYLRRGVGRKLLERVKQSFAEAGIDWYVALVRKNNDPSISLFKSSGFKDRDVFCVFEAGEG